MISLDFSQVQSFEALPVGKYVAKVAAAEEKTSQAGNQMINVTFEVVEGEAIGRKVFDNYVLTEKSLWRLKQFLASIGMGADGMVDIDLNDWLDRFLIIDVTQEEYNGNTRNRIKATSKAPDVII